MSNAMADLKTRWDDLTSWVVDDVKTKWWNKIVTAYTEPHRKYHTLEHLQHLFQHYDTNKDLLNDRYACAYAIFFHDIVYNPESGDNEKESAKLFLEFSKETTLDSMSNATGPNSQATYVITLIEATISHCTDAHLSKDDWGKDDAHYFLDFDMAILGSSPDEYNKYTRQIREEYKHLDDKHYTQNRSKLLKLFLQIPNIFATKEFREKYEDAARKNIATELEALEKSLQ